MKKSTPKNLLQAVLYHRIRVAATQVCGTPDPRDLTRVEPVPTRPSPAGLLETHRALALR